MEHIGDMERLHKVFQLLIEIALGNFSYRIERTDKKDELEALTALINIVAEELQSSFLHLGYVSLQESYMQLVHMVFLLDEDYLVVYMNQDVQRFLRLKEDELIHSPFTNIIHEDSLKVWNEQVVHLSNGKAGETELKLDFKNSKGLKHSEYCKVIIFPEDSHSSARLMIITSNVTNNKTRLENKLKQNILQKIHQPATKNERRKEGKFRLEDIKIIRAIGTYIRHHPEKEISSLRELALNFGINEFKLKRGFKATFGMTVFQFLKNERLKNSHLFVRNTQEPFKRIAYQNGFKNASLFTREFRVRYGYTPSDLRKLSQQ
ncbi:helix-turn-helix domain-containing protein [Gelidibacter salicanalis]|uniref:Helix-turn-helix domain-containing protein n=1 Tax=Gelidibacter salicanalis TaxID=291193 RepID=A0A934KUL9_9FLAO|nr:helix-turn-helix domain-containing protein [Gelidibacter salicanalis]MBJ7880508.1 helix-turn-helix domain-containing protein [Gelidibacter salicanalis]